MIKNVFFFNSSLIPERLIFKGTLDYILFFLISRFTGRVYLCFVKAPSVTFLTSEFLITFSELMVPDFPPLGAVLAELLVADYSVWFSFTESAHLAFCELSSFFFFKTEAYTTFYFHY